MSATAESILLRPTGSDDADFIFEVYTSRRADDLAALNWPKDQIAEFLSQQYAAQQRFFGTDYPEAQALIILRDNERIGTMMVDRSGDELRLIDIALLPQHCNAGIGTYLIRELLTEAEGRHRVFRVQVMRSNPAVRLFERQGLVKTGETGSHYQMEWRAASSDS